MAKRLEGKPFHLVATHCQNGERGDVVDYVRSKGLQPDTPNVSVTSFGGHPKVKGNGYVPYYMVFDHHGDLVHHHMCGDYHGGDGLKMIEVIDQLLDDVPEINVGKQPYAEIPKLAKQVASLSRLPSAIKEIERRLGAASNATDASKTERAELERLSAVIVEYRERSLRQIERLPGRDPAAVVPRLKALLKHFAGTESTTAIEAKLAEANASKELKSALKLWKTFQKTMTRYNKREEPSKKQTRSVIKKLEKLLAGNEGLPIAAKVRAALDSLK